MAEFITSNFMVGGYIYIYLFGCMLAKHLLNRLNINDPDDVNDWILSWVLVIIFIIRGK